MKLYPVSVDVKVFITDGELSGQVSYAMGLFKLPTEDGMPEIIEAISKSLPDNFRMMSRHEATMWALREKGYRGANLALPTLDDGDEWHDPATANTFSRLDDQPDDEELEG